MRTLLVALGFISGVFATLTIHYHIRPALVWAFSRGDE